MYLFFFLKKKEQYISQVQATYNLRQPFYKNVPVARHYRHISARPHCTSLSHVITVRPIASHQLHVTIARHQLDVTITRHHHTSLSHVIIARH